MRLRGALLVVWATACGGARTPDMPPERQPRAPELAALDQQFSTFPDISLAGIAYGPDALGAPIMPRVPLPRRVTLARARAKARGGKAADVQVLVTLLWSAADAAELTDAGPELRAEALAALRALRDSLGARTDAVTLQMLAAAALSGDDPKTAEAAYRDLIDRFPDRSDRATSEAWLAVSLLRQARAADAAGLFSSRTPEALEPMTAYALAWIQLTRWDLPAARAAMVEAARRWQVARASANVERDLLLILAWSATDLPSAVELLRGLAGADPARLRKLVHHLCERYHAAGEYELAAQGLALLRGRLGPGDSPATADPVMLRLAEAEHHIRLGDPARAAELLIEARTALAACGGACERGIAERVDERMVKVAVFFHNAYHDSLDGRFYAAAEALYKDLIDRGDRAQLAAHREQLANLHDSRLRADPAQGKHGQEVLFQLVSLRADGIKACYERALLVEPDLVGTVRVRLEIDPTGQVAGAASEPTEGMEGLPAVAGCALGRARTWKFPTRTVPGTTTIALTYSFQPATSFTGMIAPQQSSVR